MNNDSVSTVHYYRLGTAIADTSSGGQIKEWLSPEVKMMNSKVDSWDWSKPFEIDIPDKSLSSKYADIFRANPIPEVLPDIGEMILYSKVKLTDVISGSFLSQYGFIISDKLKDILTDYSMGSHKYYPLRIVHKNKDYSNYSFLRVANSANDYIDYSKSSFYSHKSDDIINIEPIATIDIDSKDDIDSFRKDNAIQGISISANKIVLNKAFPDFEMFTINTFGIIGYHISHKLKEALSSVSGFDIKPTDILKKHE